MYKAFTSLWSKPPPPTPPSSPASTNNRHQLTSDTSVDEDGWVLVSDTGSLNITMIVQGCFSFSSLILGLPSKVNSPNDNCNSIMTNSWIASPPLMRTDHSPSTQRSTSPNMHQFNPIENLLIEHASMSVYEQIASRTRAKRHRKTVNDIKLDEQIEGDQDHNDNNNNNDDDDNDADDDDDRSSGILQVRSLSIFLLYLMFFI